MKVRLLSDLHLELCNDIDLNFKKEADIAILAGDIGNPFQDNYKSLLRNLSLLHDEVFVITGNHEYYSDKSMSMIDDKIKRICEKEDNIHFLQMGTHIIGNVKFIGCTLWSDPHDKTLCKYMNDFTHIESTDKTFTFEKYKDIHLMHKNWLQNELLNTDHTNVVITHHLPNYQLIINEQYKDDPTNSFYATNINMKGANIACHGHTHTANTTEIDGIKYYCNPKGHKHDTSGWSPDFIFTI